MPDTAEPTRRGPAELAVTALSAALLLGGAYALVRDTPETAPTEQAAGSTAVAIQGFAFGPEQLTVPVGATVTWTNMDGQAHTVSGRDRAAMPDSGSIAGGATYENTFTTAGTFEYVCGLHPFMVGSVVVEG